MYHRYGRYGPRAWKRLQERKYSYHSTNLVPVVHREVVVYVQLPPIHTERVIFIVVPSADPYKENQENLREGNALPQESHQQLSFKQIGPAQNEHTEYYDKLKKRAIFEANTKYDLDLQNVQDRAGDWPIDQALEREANTKANVALRDYVDTSLDLDEAKHYYVTTYLATYQARYEADTENGILPTVEMKKVQEEAIRDARVNKQENYEFSSEQELNYHAVLRIQELFGYQVRLSSGYLAHILSHLPCYKQAYKEERDRLARSNPFWQAGR
jgi:hypothetical protein